MHLGYWIPWKEPFDGYLPLETVVAGSGIGAKGRPLALTSIHHCTQTVEDSGQGSCVGYKLGSGAPVAH